MIKFFRKIRQNLLSENKFSKYLIYAIGEIILVVIGILIALQINNWNEDRKTESIRQLYYQQLLEDFNIDKSYMKKRASIIDSNMMKLKTYKEAFKSSDIPLMEIYGKMGNLNWGYYDIQFQSNTITTLQNTGEIKLMPPQIRKKLISLKKYQEQSEFTSNENNNSSIELSNYSRKFYGSSDFFLNRITNQAKLFEYITEEGNLIQSLIALEGAIDMKELSEKSSLKRLEQILSDINEITILIEEELKK